MLQSLMTLLPAAAGNSGGTRRRRRGGRPEQAGGPDSSKKPIREDAGNWIWIHGHEQPGNFYLYVRKTFQLSSSPARAILKTGAVTKYKLYVNGRYAGKGPAPSGEGYVYYDTHDITNLLTKGDNVVAFLVYYIGGAPVSPAAPPPGLICKIELEEGGAVDYIATDESWKVRRATDWTDAGGPLAEGLDFQEVYDAAAALSLWNAVTFNEKGWESAAIVGVAPSMPWGELVRREIPRLAEERLLPRAIVGLFNSPERAKDTTPAQTPAIMAASELAGLTAGSVKNADKLLVEEGETQVKTPRSDRGVVLLLDFGQEVFGNVEIGVAGSGTGIIDLGYGELLEDGRVKPDRGDMKYSDRIILGKGRLDWQSFEPRAFRFIQIEFRWLSKDVSLSYVKVNQTTYPAAVSASFECSDSMLNDLWRVGVRTAKLCMNDTFVNSPWRDRAQWWTDAMIVSEVAYYAFNDTKLLQQGLRQFADSQRPDGRIAAVYPSGVEQYVPDTSLFWVFSVLECCAFTGDSEMVGELYPAVKRLLGWFASFEGQDALIGNVPGEMFIDAADLDRRGESTALNCLYHGALRAASALADIAGIEADAQAWLDAANRLKLAVNKHLYSPPHGLYAECRVDGKLVERFSRQTNVLAALFDIADHYRKSSIYRQALDGALPGIPTPYFVTLLLQALYAGDRHYEALDIIRGKWGGMLRAGATTLWEYFSQDGTLCHGWSTGPTRDLLAEYVGIKPVAGRHRFSVTPHPGDLSWARGSIETGCGKLEVGWQVSRNSLEIKIDIPQGVKVDIYPPATPTDLVTLDGKQQQADVITIIGGAHFVRVRAVKPPARPAAPVDKSLEPKPMALVEVLENTYHFGRRREIGERRPRRRPARAETGTVEIDVPIHGERSADEMTPEEIGEALGVDVSELEVLAAADIDEEPSQAAEQTSGEGDQSADETRRRSRRGGRGRRGHGRTTGQEAGEAQVPTPQGPSEPAIVHEMPATPRELGEIGFAPAGAAQPRKRTRRGGRRHRHGRPTSDVEMIHEEAVLTPEIAIPPEAGHAGPPPGEQAEAAPQPRKRTRRGGRGRHKSERETAPEGPTTPEPPPAEHVSEPVGGEQAKPKPRPRRRKPKPKPPEGENAG